MIAKTYSVDRSGVTLPLSRPRTLNLNLKFTIGNLLVLTAVVAVVVAAIAQLGLEIGILALFLGVANVVIAMRFYAAFTEHDTNCLLYTSPSPRDRTRSRMPSSA